MTEESFYIDWTKGYKFWENWNKEFDVDHMNGSVSNFKIYFSSYAYENFEDCVGLNGYLKGSVISESHSEPCGLKWDTNESSIRISSDVTWNIGDSIVPLKAIFLTTTANNYVLGYSINTNSFDVTNQLIIDEGSYLWTFHEGGNV